MRVNKPTKFLILTSQRSGSAWLISIFNQLNNITAYGELFLGRKRATEKKQWDEKFIYPRFIETKTTPFKIRPLSVFSYLDGLYSQSGVIGFKLMYSQLKIYPEILIYLAKNQIPIIHLIRRNHIDVEISRAIMKKSNKAHPLLGEEQDNSPQVELDPQTLVKQMKKLQNNREIMAKIFRLFGLRHIEIAYEDLLQDRSNFNKILDFLALNLQLEDQVQSNLAKIRRGTHAEVISNYEEVKKVLANSEFTYLLDKN